MLAQRIADKARSRPLTADAREISSVGIGGGYGFRNIMSVFGVGGLMVFTHTLEHLAASIERHAVNFLVVPPATLAGLAEFRAPAAGPYPALRGVEAGGSLMSPELYALARERICGNILSSYGSTEASVVATAPMVALAGNPGAVGFLLPGVEVDAVDDSDTPLPRGAEGHLRIRGANCVMSYLGDPTATAASFRNGWFYPGDIGSVSATGMMRVAGRASEIINSGGDKIAPHVIEDVLSKLHGVKEVAAFGVPGRAGVTEVWAAIVVNGTINADALATLCRNELRIMMPKSLMRVDAIPRNENGKVQRDQLVKMAIAQRDGGAAKEAQKS
jgi:acyl-coenzyme A synthetase/AMP-(fatty) acid ligase